MAFLWVKDRDVAQDLLQNVYEKAWKLRVELQNMENPTGWMVKSLRNESLQHFRQSKRFENLDHLEAGYMPQDHENNHEDTIKRVFHFLESLPEKQQEIFQLREVEGLTYEEIAQYMDISVDQVKVNLFRARKSLRDQLRQKINER